MALEVKIKKKLAHFTLDVDFHMENEVLAFLGASGCGKSMTLKCIAGIEQPDEGRIVLNGRVLFDSKENINLPPQQRHVGYLFQDYALFPNMTVWENILVGVNSCSKSDIKSTIKKLKNKEDNSIKTKMVHSYIDQFHLSGLENQYPSKLSGGQKQRVALARMLAAKPEVILLDEPFSALDSHLKWELEQQMAETLKTENKPTVFVSHNRDEVYRISTKVACIENGKMEEARAVKDFFNNPRSRMAALLSGCKNVSKVEWIDDTHVRAVDWNVELDVSGIEHEKEVNYIGIRAHFLTPLYVDNLSQNDLQSGNARIPHFTDIENIICIKDYKVIEDPFEWILMFRNVTKADSNDSVAWLWWKTPKIQDKLQIPKGFSVDKANLLLLK